MPHASEDEMPTLRTRRKLSRAAFEILGFGFQLQMAKMQYLEFLKSEGLSEDDIAIAMDSMELNYRIIFIATGTSLASFGYVLRKFDVTNFMSVLGIVSMYIGMFMLAIQILKNKTRIDAAKLAAKFESLIKRHK